MLRSALALVHRGCAVFPCRQRSKLPATERGFLDASKDPAVVERWWRSDPAYNVAVATGRASGILVVDVDGLDAEGALRKIENENGALPPTVEVITGQGRHIWFRMSDADVRCSASRLAANVDVRANGGYVLTPPSVHPSGRRYTWSVDCAPALADAPYWLLAKIASRTNSNGNGNGGIPPAEWRELVKGVAEGARDCSAAKLAGHLLRRHVDPFVALELLHAWNETRCAPPLPSADIERIIASIAGRELRRRGADG